MIPGAAAVWKSLPAAQRRMLLLLLAAVAIANVAQPYPELAPLQHGPTVMLTLAAPFLLRRWPLGNGAVACIFAFLLLHTLGGRYIYSYVPYDEWARVLTGHDISSTFGLKRNGYDRFVHFAFGILLTLPFAEMARRFGGMKVGWALAFSFAMIGLVGSLYEIFEWALTLIAEGATADWYNGQQGDIWDPQKDLAAAQMGSLLSVIFLSFRRSRQTQAKTISPASEFQRSRK